MANSRPVSFVKKILYSITLLRSLSIVALIWAGALAAAATTTRFPRASSMSDFGDLATLLFGSSSIAIVLFSLLIAIFGFIGWRDLQERVTRVEDLEREVRSRLDKASLRAESFEIRLTNQVDSQSTRFEKERLEPLKSEIIGRQYSLLGFFMGESSLDRDTFRVTSQDKMKEAIGHCQAGYDLLKGVGVEAAAEFMALNNLIFYSTILNDVTRRDFLLEQARRLLTAAQGHGAINLLLTGYRAVLQFGLDHAERERALAAMAALSTDSKATPAQKKEAQNALINFSKLAV